MERNLYLSTALVVCMVLMGCTSSVDKVEPAIPRDERIEEQVEELLRNMTLEEKVGQMCQLTIQVLQDNDVYPGFAMSEEKLDEIIGKLKVGSILNTPYGVARTVEEWQDIVTRIQKKSIEIIGIPCIYGLDQIHGATYTMDATFFPQNINMAATFNRALMRESARISAYETKTGSIPWTFSPVTDLGRDPRWARMWESFGEDPYVNAEMGRESVLGFQGDDPNHLGDERMAACLKHFMGYGVPVSGKDRTPSSISVQDMRERHFAPYLEMIRNGALSLMVNSGINNGMPFHANTELLTGWLKEELNWDGMIVTDWSDITNLYSRDHIAKDLKEAIKIAINAGIDMAMEPYNLEFCPLLIELVNEGEVSMARIDDAVRRILRLKYRLNLFEKPYYDFKEFPHFGSKEHAAVALKAAEESMVLLKNTDNILPIASGKKLLVTGPNANLMCALNGGWSYTWQGQGIEEFAAEHHTILEALSHKYGADNVIYEPGVTYKENGNWWEENVPQIQKAVVAASRADYIIACIGESAYCETPGNLSDLTLSENQRNLVKALAKTGKPIILVLNEGRPRLIADIEPLSKAVINGMLPSNSGGDALANLLAGDANFSGKLPYTYPKEINSLVTYDYKPCEHIGKPMEGAYNYDAVVNVQWAFGYGLSYTTFAYSNFMVDKTNFTADDVLTFTVDVTNTGKRVGKESVLLFSSDLIASLTPDNRRLRNFEKVELQPGETQTVTLTLKGSDLAFVGYDGKWVLEAGDFRMQAGNQVVNIVCTETKKWETPNK